MTREITEAGVDDSVLEMTAKGLSATSRYDNSKHLTTLSAPRKLCSLHLFQSTLAMNSLVP
ncbi:hypothetical protein E2C01_015742 [Portunus trituberculatus]|uniref:Uncharacterized protein n=1 Tax=Portunus trituberculatus TaxID=210409 RepID=A0A5B7DMB2_PORTR|nr:hypothetical protein [Portunus trituberculatus]